jgi:hypothetical protein
VTAAERERAIEILENAIGWAEARNIIPLRAAGLMLGAFREPAYAIAREAYEHVARARCGDAKPKIDAIADLFREAISDLRGVVVDRPHDVRAPE